MEQIAFITGHAVFYWRPLLLSAGVVTSIFFFLSLYLRKKGQAVSAACAVPLALVLGMMLSRLVHWYCRPGDYSSLQAALTDYSQGGFALLGVFAGCLVTALLLRLLQISDSAPAMLDCMSIAGAAGIAVGRLASFFDASDRGPLMQTLRSLPWAYPVTNSVSGAVEYRLATFLIQAMCAGALFLLLLVFHLAMNRKNRLRPGDSCLLFLLLYASTQVVLDSTRYDSLAFRSNGFVSVVQVFSALAIGFTAVFFSVRLVKLQGMRPWYIGIWVLIAAMLATAGYMEYYVQRHASLAVLSYSVMSAALAVIALAVTAMLLLTPGPASRRRPGRYLASRQGENLLDPFGG